MRKLSGADKLIAQEMGADHIGRRDNLIPYSRVAKIIRNARVKWIAKDEAGRAAVLIAEATEQLTRRVSELESDLEAAKPLYVKLRQLEAQANGLRAQLSEMRDSVRAFAVLQETLERDPAGLLADLARVNPKIKNYLSVFATMAAASPR